MEDSVGIKFWVIYGGPLNHLPIILQVEMKIGNPRAHFQFNHTLFIEEDFRGLITRTWKLFNRKFEDVIMKKFANHLKMVKGVMSK